MRDDVKAYDIWPVNFTHKDWKRWKAKAARKRAARNRAKKRQGKTATTKTAQAIAFLQDVLANGPQPVADILRLAVALAWRSRARCGAANQCAKPAMPLALCGTKWAWIPAGHGACRRRKTPSKSLIFPKGPCFRQTTRKPLIFPKGPFCVRPPLLEVSPNEAMEGWMWSRTLIWLVRRRRGRPATIYADVPRARLARAARPEFVASGFAAPSASRSISPLSSER